MALKWSTFHSCVCPTCFEPAEFAYLDDGCDYFLLRHRGRVTTRSTLANTDANSPVEWRQWVSRAHAPITPPDPAFAGVLQEHEMSYIKVRPLEDQTFRATVWRDQSRGPLTGAAEYLGRLTLRAGRHYVCPRGEDYDTHWYTQLTKALTHLATGQPTEEAHTLAVARGSAPVGAAGYIDGRTANGDNLKAAIVDQAETKHAVTTNRHPSAD